MKGNTDELSKLQVAVEVSPRRREVFQSPDSAVSPDQEFAVGVKANRMVVGVGPVGVAGYPADVSPVVSTVLAIDRAAYIGGTWAAVTARVDDTRVIGVHRQRGIVPALTA